MCETPRMTTPDIRYAWRDEVSLAYQELGNGPLDLLYLQGYLSNVEVNWENPGLARFLRELALISRLIVTDRRGLGLSERFTPADTPATEVLMEDVTAVLEAAQSKRAVLFATGDCGPVAMLFAATYPDRVAGLILYGTHPTVRLTEDTPWGQTAQDAQRDAQWVRRQLGSGKWMVRTNPSLSDLPNAVAWAARYERLSLTPGAVYSESLRFSETDVRSVLPVIQVPTLVLHRTEDPEDEVQAGRLLAERIRTAEFLELPGGDHFPWVGDQDSVLGEVKAFLRTIRDEESEFNRVLATVMFTDIVNSTRRASELGDRDWAAVLEAHQRVMRSVLSRYKGTEVNTTGDGFMATFDGPGRAVRCALASVEAVRQVGVEIRAGCHTGEIQSMGDDIGGIAVHAASRVAALADPGEVLVSRTVKELSVGSGLVFSDRGVHALKGVPDEWPLFAVHQD